MPVYKTEGSDKLSTKSFLLPIDMAYKEYHCFCYPDNQLRFQDLAAVIILYQNWEQNLDSLCPCFMPWLGSNTHSGDTCLWGSAWPAQAIKQLKVSFNNTNKHCWSCWAPTTTEKEHKTMQRQRGTCHKRGTATLRAFLFVLERTM